MQPKVLQGRTCSARTSRKIWARSATGKKPGPPSSLRERPAALWHCTCADERTSWRPGRRGSLEGEEKTCACAWHLLRIRAGVLLPPPPPGAAVALRCVAPQESRQFGAWLSAGPHPVGDGTRACACAPGPSPLHRRELGRYGAWPLGTSLLRAPQPAAACPPRPCPSPGAQAVGDRPPPRSTVQGAAVRRPAHSRRRPSGLPSPQAVRTLEGGSSLCRYRRGQAGR